LRCCRATAAEQRIEGAPPYFSQRAKLGWEQLHERKGNGAKGVATNFRVLVERLGGPKEKGRREKDRDLFSIFSENIFVK
jgi:hypothetical protein